MSKEYQIGDIVHNPTTDLMDHYTAEWVDVGVVKITGYVEEQDETDN